MPIYKINAELRSMKNGYILKKDIHNFKGNRRMRSFSLQNSPRLPTAHMIKCAILQMACARIATTNKLKSPKSSVSTQIERSTAWGYAHHATPTVKRKKDGLPQ